MQNRLSRNRNNDLTAYLSPLAVWALSFGCIVGWGSFVMPGTTFLPKAGPLGSLIGLLLGAVIMFVIAFNYYRLIKDVTKWVEPGSDNNSDIE